MRVRFYSFLQNLTGVKGIVMRLKLVILANLSVVYYTWEEVNLTKNK